MPLLTALLVLLRIQQYVETPAYPRSSNVPDILAPPLHHLSPPILAGNAAAPGGNIELGTITDGLGNAAFAGAAVTTLTVNLAGGDLVFSSLTLADWGAIGSGGLLDQWTNNLYSAYGSYINDPVTGLPVSQNVFQNTVCVVGRPGNELVTLIFPMLTQTVVSAWLDFLTPVYYSQSAIFLQALRSVK